MARRFAPRIFIIGIVAFCLAAFAAVVMAGPVTP